LAESELWCKSCGKKLEAGSEFCPKCGASTKGVQDAKAATGGKIGGVDKRLAIGILVVLVILMLPIFPRTETVYVSGTTMTTEIYQSTSFQTSLQAYSTVSQQSIPVYTGTLQYVLPQYYGYYAPYYGACVRGYYGIIRCGGFGGWPNLSLYTTTVTISPSQNVVNIQSTPGPNGYLSTVVLTMANGGGTMTYNNVFNSNLAQTGTSTAQVTVTATSTVTGTTMVPATTVMSVPCNTCVPQNVTRHVSILQILFGL